MKLCIDLDSTTINVGGHNLPDWWKRWHDDAWQFLDAPPMEGAVETLQALHVELYDIVYVTARPEHPVTHQWLDDHDLDFAPLIEATPQKWAVDADVWLDDSPTVLEGLWKRGKCVVKYAQPHNALAPCRHVVQSWNDFYTLVTGDHLDLGVRHNIPHKWEARRLRAANGDARVRG